MLEAQLSKRRQSSGELMVAYIRMSSAYSLTVQSRSCTISLMKMRNNSGVNTIPCGTPERTEEGLLLIPCCKGAAQKRTCMYQFLQMALVNC